MSELSSESQVDTSYENFKWWGWALGGMLPIVFICVLEGFHLTNIFADEYYGPFVSISIAYGIISFLLFGIIDKFKILGKKRSVLLSIIAFISIFTIHVLVSFMGGTALSVLAFSYIYLPTVVSFEFDKKTLIWTSIFCLFSGSLNIFFPNIAPEVSSAFMHAPDGVEANAYFAKLISEPLNAELSIWYKFLYFSILCLQILAATLLGSNAYTERAASA